MTIDKETRQNKVLEAIVRSHIASALPVGSNHIARVLGLSSATIRNVMFQLETSGYVKQPHTSAGRIPTDLGYRKYIDNIASFQKVARKDIFSMIRRYMNKQRFFNDAMESISNAVSRLTNYTSIALSPNKRFYFEGTYHMLEQPEFSKPDSARNFLRILEEKKEIIRIMSENLAKTGMTIRIGRENIFENLRECAVVTSVYRVNSYVSGTIGVIGPIRMRYDEVVPVLESMAEIATEILEDFPDE